LLARADEVVEQGYATSTWHETDMPMQSPHVRYQGMNRLRSGVARGPLMTDTVEKVFWGWRTKFSGAADAFRAQRCEGPRRISEKRQRTFVSALRRISTTELSKNQHLRDFWRRSIFDFFNSIDP
jgi:hypothetical protein